MNVVIGISVFCALVLAFAFGVTAQREAIDEWETYCNDEYGCGNWEIRDATWEERANFSAHIVPLHPLGQVSVCVPKET